MLGVHELEQRESAFDTTTLCVKLFNGMGFEINPQDIDIAHRVPNRHGQQVLSRLFASLFEEI